jgi:hypothetical protein
MRTGRTFCVDCTWKKRHWSREKNPTGLIYLHLMAASGTSRCKQETILCAVAVLPVVVATCLAIIALGQRVMLRAY